MTIVVTAVEYKYLCDWKPPLLVHTLVSVCPSEHIETFIEELMNDIGVIKGSIKIRRMVPVCEKILKEVAREIDVIHLPKYMEALTDLSLRVGMYVADVVHFS